METASGAVSGPVCPGGAGGDGAPAFRAVAGGSRRRLRRDATALFGGYSPVFPPCVSRAGRPDFFYYRRGCVSGYSDVEGIRNAAGTLRFRDCEPAGHTAGGAAAGDSARPAWPAGREAREGRGERFAQP